LTKIAGLCKIHIFMTTIRMDAYAAGINDFVDSMEWYPIEFYMTHTSFEPWTVEDSIGI
jgi:hypothetical protein